MLLPARYWPSALMAMAHISPGLFWSAAQVSSTDFHFVVYDLAMKAQGVPTNYLSVLAPHAVLVLAPYLDLALEARTGGTSCLVFSRSDQVVDAERMRLV
jgi:hypothetical protein